MTLRDEIEAMLLCHIPREHERREIIIAILQAVEKVVPEDIERNLPNCVLNHPATLAPYEYKKGAKIGWNACRSAMLKKIRGE